MCRRCLFIVTSAMALLAACQDAGPPETVVSVRDSAGIIIVSSTAPGRFEAPWSLSDVPEWAVGELEGDADYLLSQVTGAMQLPTGEIVVGNRGTNEVRFYRPDGAFARSRGGEGEGPGEFRYLRALAPCHPEGFVAFDLNWQMNVYRVDGTFVERTTLRTPAGVTPYNLACDEHGHVLILGWGRDATEGPGDGFYQAYDDLLLTNLDGDIQANLGRRLASDRIGRPSGSGPHPAGRATDFDLHDDRVFVGSGARFEVEVRGLDGSLLRLLRGPDISLEVTDSVRSLVLESRLARAPPDRHAAIRSDVAEWEWPESLPAYTALMVDSEGVVWVRAYTADPEAAEAWSLLHPGRGYLGDISLEPRQTLLEVGLDYVLVLTTDELDVERVEKYALGRNPA